MMNVSGNKQELIFHLMKNIFIGFGCVFFLWSCQSSGVKTDNNIGFSSPIDSLSALIKNNKKDDNIFYQRGKLFYLNNNLDDAINDLSIAISIDSTKPEYYIALAQYYMLNKHSEKSHSLLKRAEKNFPENIPILLELGKLYLYVSNYNTSKSYFDHVLEIDNYNGMAYYYKGIIAKEENKPVTLKKFMQKSIQYLPDFYDGYFALGLSYVNDIDSMAIQYLNTAIRLKPASIEAYYALGMYYQNADNPIMAVKQYEFILDSLDSNFTDAYYNIGYLLLTETNKYNESKRYFKKVLTIDSNRIDALYNLGLAHEMLTEYSQSSKLYKQALVKQPNYDLAIKGLNRLDKK